jgi:hypothetical protein
VPLAFDDRSALAVAIAIGECTLSIGFAVVKFTGIDIAIGKPESAYAVSKPKKHAFG